MPSFRVRITRVITEVYVYRATAPDLAAARLTAEANEPDPDTMKSHTEIKRVAVTEMKAGGKS